MPYESREIKRHPQKACGRHFCIRLGPGRPCRAHGRVSVLTSFFLQPTLEKHWAGLSLFRESKCAGSGISDDLQLRQDKVGAKSKGGEEGGQAEVADDHERCELPCHVVVEVLIGCGGHSGCRDHAGSSKAPQGGGEKLRTGGRHEDQGDEPDEPEGHEEGCEKPGACTGGRHDSTSCVWDLQALSFALSSLSFRCPRSSATYIRHTYST